MSDVLEYEPMQKREKTALEIALSGDTTIDPVTRELQEMERRSDRFLTECLKRRMERQAQDFAI